MTADTLPVVALAAILLFTTPPSDRALDGWQLDESWLCEELNLLDLRERVV